MTKKELLAELESKDFVKRLISVDKVNNTSLANVNWYDANVFDCVGKCGIGRSISFYVLDEGTESEAAFYKDREPETSIQTKVEPI